MTKLRSIDLPQYFGRHRLYQTEKGLVLRAVGGPKPNQVKKDPRFIRTRENMQEFASVAKGNSLLRRVFFQELNDISCKRLTPKLTQYLTKVIRTDQVNKRGSRQLSNGDFLSMKDLDLSDDYPLSSRLGSVYESGLNARDGKAWIRIPAFDPRDKIKAPSGATHFQLISAAAEIDFETGRFENSRKESAILPLEEKTAPMILSHMLNPDAEGALFLVLGIIFYEFIGGKYEPIRSGAALRLIEVCNE